MSLPLPRPVGVASLADVLVVELREPVDPAEALTRLHRQMPPGLMLTEAFEVRADRKLRPEQATHEVAVPPCRVPAVHAAVERLLACERWLIERTDARGQILRTLDLRALLIDASIESGSLRWTHRVSDSGSARPAEWLRAFGLEPTELLHHVRRTDIHWQTRTGEASPAVEAVGASPDSA